MAITKPTGADLALSVTTDANGWTVYDYGTFKQYRKRGSFGFTIAASAWSSALGTSGNLPVGMSTIGNNYVDGVLGYGDAAITGTINAESARTTVGFNLTNQYGQQLSGTIVWSVTITTP